MGVVQRLPAARWGPAAGLGAIILVGAVIGFAVSRPPAPPAAVNVPAAPAAPRTAFGYSAVDDPVHHEVVLFGGVDSYSQTWLWNGKRWTLTHPSTSPTGRFDAPAAFDPDTGQVMLYGGRLADGELAGDTWAWDGTTWRQLDTGANGPPAGEGGAMAWDPGLQTMVLVAPIATPTGLTGETWLWQGGAWSRVTGGNFPAGVTPIAAVFDDAIGTLFAIGGAGNPTNADGLFRFVPVRWNGGSWHVLPARQVDSFAGLAEDPISGRLIVAAENGFPVVPATSTAWSWTGSDWQTLHNTQGPPWPQAEVTDLAHGRLLLFATLLPASQDTPQTVYVWEWQGTHWARVDGG
ncbi:MAG: hypothetical protein JOZ75_08295 [Candidatus Dormibacteraeota bacterium]|nr:hypothetical protein [Candidatus Dormibacteraeota bacterium]